jgi:hypothetical protein
MALAVLVGVAPLGGRAGLDGHAALPGRDRMKKEKSNLAASVTARLLNRARQTGDDYQTLLTSFY